MSHLYTQYLMCIYRASCMSNAHIQTTMFHVYIYHTWKFSVVFIFKNTMKFPHIFCIIILCKFCMYGNVHPCMHISMYVCMCECMVTYTNVIFSTLLKQCKQPRGKLGIILGIGEHILDQLLLNLLLLVDLWFSEASKLKT